MDIIVIGQRIDKLLRALSLKKGGQKRSVNTAKGYDNCGGHGCVETCGIEGYCSVEADRYSDYRKREVKNKNIQKLRHDKSRRYL
jgi:hypothetical protein